MTNKQDDKGWTALHMACKYGHVNVIEVINRFNYISKWRSSWKKTNEPAESKILIQTKTADPNITTKDGLSGLWIAIESDKSNVETVTELLKHGTNIDESHIVCAAIHERYNVIKTIYQHLQRLLQDKREILKMMDDSTNGYTPLIWASTMEIKKLSNI